MAPAYQPTDRRPIASRERKIWQKLASVLAARGVSPNLISMLGMFAGIGAGAALYCTGETAGREQRVLWFLSAVGMQLRLLANMLDGMVAIESGRASALGELYNELPDRASDVVVLVGAGYAAGSSPALGYIAACIAILTAYVRAIGKSAGASNLFVGPMAKPHRMFTMTLVSLAMLALPFEYRPDWGKQHVGLAAVGLTVIIIGGCVTVFRRIALTVRHLQSSQ